jgi:hypothetical protein
MQWTYLMLRSLCLIQYHALSKETNDSREMIESRTKAGNVQARKLAFVVPESKQMIKMCLVVCTSTYPPSHT